MALVPNSRPFGCSTLAFLFVSLKTFFPTSPSSREPGFLRLLGAPWDAQFAFLPIDYFLRSLPYLLGGIRCFRVTSFFIPVCFVLVVALLGEHPISLNRFSDRHLLCGVCGSCLAPTCWSGCFPWPKLFPHAASDGFLSSDSLLVSLSGRFLSSQGFFCPARCRVEFMP